MSAVELHALSAYFPRDLLRVIFEYFAFQELKSAFNMHPKTRLFELSDEECLFTYPIKLLGASGPEHLSYWKYEDKVSDVYSTTVQTPCRMISLLQSRQQRAVKDNIGSFIDNKGAVFELKKAIMGERKVLLGDAILDIEDATWAVQVYEEGTSKKITVFKGKESPLGTTSGILGFATSGAGGLFVLFVSILMTIFILASNGFIPGGNQSGAVMQRLALILGPCAFVAVILLILKQLYMDHLQRNRNLRIRNADNFESKYEGMVTGCSIKCDKLDAVFRCTDNLNDVPSEKLLRKHIMGQPYNVNQELCDAKTNDVVVIRQSPDGMTMAIITKTQTGPRCTILRQLLKFKEFEELLLRGCIEVVLEK